MSTSTYNTILNYTVKPTTAAALSYVYQTSMTSESTALKFDRAIATFFSTLISNNLVKMIPNNQTVNMLYNNKLIGKLM